MATRTQNEDRFDSWEPLPAGGRRYSREILGRSGRAIYWKEVDANERTVRFWQEIFDSRGKLIAIHEKFPVDKGHRKV